MPSQPQEQPPHGRQLLPRVLAVAAVIVALLVLVTFAGDWFEVRPASGTAAAMSRAAERPSGS